MPAKKAPPKITAKVAAEPVEEAPADEPATLNDAGWRDPASVYADDDNSIDARMWRLSESRPK